MSNHAIKYITAGNAQIQTVPIPKLRDDYILVTTAAFAINPTDWKHVDLFGKPGVTIGADYAGTVLEVGSKVTQDFKKGDRIFGLGHGGNVSGHEDGVFAEICTVKAAVQSKIPENLSFEEAATLGAGITSIGQGLYQSLGLPLPSAETETKTATETILVYGGSTATGILAIQYAKLSGFNVLATSSPHNFAYLKSLGASEVFDYSSPSCAKDIKAFTNGELKYVYDCIALDGSTRISIESMSSSGGKYSALLPISDDKLKSFSDKVEGTYPIAYTAFGEYFVFAGQEYKANPEDLEHAKMFWELSRGLLAEGKVKGPKIKVNMFGKGLEGVLKGMQHMREGKVSGEKLVYTM